MIKYAFLDENNCIKETSNNFIAHLLAFAESNKDNPDIKKHLEFNKENQAKKIKQIKNGKSNR